MRATRLADADCAIAQAVGIVGDWWTFLVIRDIAGGLHRFDELVEALGVSRKILAERLKLLVEHDVLERRQYSQRPPRFEYHLTATGRGLTPVLMALQDWGSRFVMGDGTVTATTESTSPEAHRVRALTGQRVPELTVQSIDDEPVDLVADTPWTVLYCFPGAFAPDVDGHPPGWASIPGAQGCVLESCTYRDRLPDFTARGATVYGVSTQRPDQLGAFAKHARIQFPLLSDHALQLAAALRLPTFRAAGVDRLKRLTLLIDRDRTVRDVLYPVPDPAGSVEEVLGLLDSHEAGTRRSARSTRRAAPSTHEHPGR